jgi:hypothetical protein
MKYVVYNSSYSLKYNCTIVQKKPFCDNFCLKRITRHLFLAQRSVQLLVKFVYSSELSSYLFVIYGDQIRRFIDPFDLKLISGKAEYAENAAYSESHNHGIIRLHPYVAF